MSDPTGTIKKHRRTLKTYVGLPTLPEDTFANVAPVKTRSGLGKGRPPGANDKPLVVKYRLSAETIPDIIPTNDAPTGTEKVNWPKDPGKPSAYKGARHQRPDGNRKWVREPKKTQRTEYLLITLPVMKQVKAARGIIDPYQAGRALLEEQINAGNKMTFTPEEQEKIDRARQKMLDDGHDEERVANPVITPKGGVLFPARSFPPKTTSTPHRRMMTIGRVNSPDIMARLVHIALNSRDERASIAASSLVLDRTYGKAKEQPVDQDTDMQAKLDMKKLMQACTDEELSMLKGLFLRLGDAQRKANLEAEASQPEPEVEIIPPEQDFPDPDDYKR